MQTARRGNDVTLQMLSAEASHKDTGYLKLIRCRVLFKTNPIAGGEGSSPASAEAKRQCTSRRTGVVCVSRRNKMARLSARATGPLVASDVVTAAELRVCIVTRREHEFTRGGGLFLVILIQANTINLFG